jgi:hypothetical protein
VKFTRIVLLPLKFFSPISSTSTGEKEQGGKMIGAGGAAALALGPEIGSTELELIP